MKAPRPPLFVAPDAYRRRRLRDAARMLPVLGAVLMLLPVLWGGGEGQPPRSTAIDGLYLFGIWGVLIVAARLMAPGLADDPQDGTGPPREE